VKPAPKTKIAAFKLTAEQYQLIAQRADRCGVRMGAWMRSVVLQAASRPRPQGEGYLRIREPNGVTT
jgi:hypothetical protein